MSNYDPKAIKSESIHAQVEEAMRLASNKDRAQVEAAIAEAQITGVGILVDGKHVPYDIYQANHAVTRKPRHEYKPLLRPVKTLSGKVEWQADFQGAHARGIDAAQAYDMLAKYLGFRLQSRPASYGIPRSLVQQKRSIVVKPHLRVFSSKGWARWAASFHGYVGYGRTAKDAFDRLTVIYNDATMNNRSC